MIVKLCGLRTVADVRAAEAAGADWVGFVLAESVRQVPLDALAELVAACERAEPVVVMRAPAPEALVAARAAGVRLVQSEAKFGRPALGAGQVWLPVLLDGVDAGGALAELVRDGVLSGELGAQLVLDGPRGGGAGKEADVGRAGALAREARLMLAGGLHPGNVGAAVRAVRPAGVDVSSGIERAPGYKDAGRMVDFVLAARRAAEA